MWNKIAGLVIRYRLTLVILIGLITVVMGYYASRVEMSYDFARTVPLDDPDMIELDKFRSQFGEDGNVIAVGVKDSSLYQLKFRSVPGTNARHQKDSRCKRSHITAFVIDHSEGYC